VKKFLLAFLLCAFAPLPAVSADDTTYAALHPSEPAIAAGSGRIYVYRESSILDVAQKPDVYIDGKPVWVAKNGDYYYVDRPAGSYVISTSPDDADQSVTLPLAAGQRAYVRVHIQQGVLRTYGQPSISSPQDAEDDIKDCNFAPQDAVTAQPPNPAPAPASN
jgi:hypothetical protein